MIRKGMAEPVDDLNAPLGRNIPVNPERAGFIIRWRIIAAAAAVLLLGTAAGALLATYPIGRHAAPSTPPVPAAAEKTGTIPESQSIEIVRPRVPPAVPVQKPDTDPSATQTITIIDGTSGKREQIVVPVKPPSAR